MKIPADISDRIEREVRRRLEIFKNAEVPDTDSVERATATQPIIDTQVSELILAGCTPFCGAFHLGSRMTGPRLYSLAAAVAHLKGFVHQCVPAGQVGEYALNAHQHEDRQKFRESVQHHFNEAIKLNGHKLPTFNETGDKIARPTIQFERPKAQEYAFNTHAYEFTLD